MTIDPISRDITIHVGRAARDTCFVEDKGVLVMGSIEENRYRYGIDTQISFRKASSQTSHPQVSRHVFHLLDFEFFRFLRPLSRF